MTNISKYEERFGNNATANGSFKKPSNFGHEVIDTIKAIVEIRKEEKAYVTPFIKAKTEKKVSAVPFPRRWIAFLSLCMIFAILMVIHFARLYDITRTQSTLENEIANYEVSLSRLNSEIADEIDPIYAYEYATNSLGMISNSKVKTLQVSSDITDEVVYENVTKKNGTIVGELMSVVGDNFRDYWNIFSK